MKANGVMISILAVDGWVRDLLCSRVYEAAEFPRPFSLRIVSGARPVDVARNTVADQFLASNCEWLITIDHDTVPVNGFMGIIPQMEADGKQIAGLPTVVAMSGHEQLVFNISRRDDEKGWYHPLGLKAGWSEWH